MKQSLLLKSVFRSSPMFKQPSQLMATRGGFHKPDPPHYPMYKHTRRIHLEDINTIIYNDNAPEFHMHLHSM